MPSSTAISSFTTGGQAPTAGTDVVLDGHSVFGGGARMRDLELAGNYFYNERPQFGYQSKHNDGLIMRDNVFPSGFSLYWWKNVTATGNAIFNKTQFAYAIHILQDGPLDLGTYGFDKNIYRWSKPSPAAVPGPGALFQNTSVPDNDPAQYLRFRYRSGRTAVKTARRRSKTCR